jgi:hypothetical protein
MHEAQTYSDGTGDFNALKQTLEPAGRTIPGQALIGNWRCRNMKMGGMNAYIVYQWFNCRISVVNGGLFFQKPDGTLKTQGFLYPENGSWIYLGAQSAKGEPWHLYSGRRNSLGAPATPDDQIGLLTGIGNNRLRIEIPGRLKSPPTTSSSWLGKPHLSFPAEHCASNARGREPWLLKSSPVLPAWIPFPHNGFAVARRG